METLRHALGIFEEVALLLIAVSFWFGALRFAGRRAKRRWRLFP